MTTRLSLSGSTKKINSELSLCNRVLTYTRSSTDSAVPANTLKRLQSSLTILISVTLHHAQPTSELHLELQFTSDSLNSHRNGKSSKKLLTNSTYRLEVFTVNIQNQLNQFTIFQTREDSEDQKETLSKTCMMVSKL